MPDISVVIPVFNEEANLPVLYDKVRAAVGSLGKSYECLFVDDGSEDRSRQVIESLREKYPEVRLIALRRNFGQTAALSAGFNESKGDIIVTLDADLQNDPVDIPMLVRKLEEGYDLVSGWRKRRKDAFMRVLTSSVANRLISQVTGVKLHDSGCTLKVYRKEVLKELHLYGQMHRFIPALASWAGVRLIEIPVRHAPRYKGKSKYGFSRIGQVLLDLLTVKFLLSYSTSPIQMFGKIGMLSSLFGFIIFAVTVVLKLTQERTFTGNPLFYLFIFMEVIAVQFVLFGLLGEIMIRTYHEAQKKKTYVIKQ